MDVSLTQDESAAVRKALRSYLSDLRAEIVDTDNPQYKRELREERVSLESAVEKLDQVVPASSEASTEAHAVRIIEIFWSTDGD